MNRQAFLKLKQDRLEKLIRGGLLKQAEAHSKLVAFTHQVRRVLAAGLPREVIILTCWAFVALC